MRKIGLAIVYALLALAAYGNEDVTPAAVGEGSTLEVIGPDSVLPGEDAWLKINGLTMEEIKTAKADGLFDLTVFPLAGVRVHASYDWLNDSLELMFRAKAAGEYLVKLHLVRDSKLEVAAIVVVVEGDSPDPRPGPEPGPLPPGKPLVLILSESQDRTPAEVEVTTALRRYLDSRNLEFRLIDPDQQSEWLSPVREKLQETALPVLAALVQPTGTDDVLYLAGSCTLPGRIQEAVAFVEEALGE